MTHCHRAQLVFGKADVAKTPQAAVMIKTQTGSSDAPGSLQVCRNYPESSGPLGESCEIEGVLWQCLQFHYQDYFQHKVSVRLNFLTGFTPKWKKQH